MAHVRLRITVGLVAVLGAAGCGGTADKDPGTTSSGAATLTSVKVVLPWFIQGESAGHMVAREKGFYKDVGLDVEILPGGPDVRATSLLASDTVQFAIFSPASVLTARGEGLPLVALWTQNQEDGYQLVCRKKSGINSWTDLSGKKVGAWFGGPEYGIWYALQKVGLKKEDVQLLPQKALSEFFQNKIDCASAMAWNELHSILAEVPADQLTILKVSDVGVNLPGDSGVTTERMVTEHPDQVQGFVTASLRGWRYALEHPEEAADMTLKYAPDLDRAAQIVQIKEVAKLMVAGPVQTTKRLGTQSVDSWKNIETTLRDAGQLKGNESVEKAINNTFLDKVPTDIVTTDGLPESS